MSSTISIAPTWKAITPMLAMILRDATPKGQTEALEELRRMARAADLYNASVADPAPVAGQRRLPPSWSAVLPILAEAIRSHAEPSRKAAMEELLQMATAADLAAASASEKEAEHRAEERRAADAEADEALEHDDSEWADRQRGYGQSDEPRQNDAGEWIGYM